MRNLLKKFTISRATSAYLMRFTMYNVVGAMIPLLVSWSIRRIGSLQDPPGAYAPELLFFGVMVSATALGDLIDERELTDGTLFQFVKGILLFSCIAVATIYGVYQYDVIIGPGSQAIRTNITTVAFWAAVILFLASLIAETLVAKFREARMRR